MSRPSPQTERIIDLVDLLSSRPEEGFTLAEIARAAGLGKATVHPMVVTLTRRGWLLRHPGSRTYRLGPALIAAGRAAAKGDAATAAARPIVRELAATTGLICVVLAAGGIPGADDELVVGEVAQPPGTDFTSGAARGPWPGYRGLRLGDRISPRPPLGAVGVAWAGQPAVDAWLGRLEPDQRASAAAELAPGLAAIRARGWAVEVVDHLGERLSSLAAEFDADQRNAEHAAALRQVLNQIGKAYSIGDTLPARIEPTGSYQASVLNAPVFDARGAVSLMICLLCVPDGDEAPTRSGAHLLDLGERLRAAADRITRETHGRLPVSE
jgi:DNA-binding IclR family transcriptional regulator